MPSAELLMDTFNELTTFDNLYSCWGKVKSGKNTKQGIDKFEASLFENLLEIQSKLRMMAYNFGPYHHFKVREKGKERDVVNASLKDKVVHWVLYRHLKTTWEKKFIGDSFGNIEGRGTHKAVLRFASFVRKPTNGYALKIDLSKYFYSIPHDELKQILFSNETNPRIVETLNLLIDSYITDTRYDMLFSENSPYRLTKNKGIPIGNLTSQIFANIFLTNFDSWIKHQLHVKYYIRYVDDIVILHGDKRSLSRLFEKINDHLLSLKITTNPKKVSIRKTTSGIPWLGYIVWPNHISAGQHLRSRYHKCLHESAFKDKTQALISYKGAFAWTGATR